MWAPGLGGEVGIGNAVTDIDISFGDILEDLEIAAMLQFEARKGRWGFLFDGFWLQLSDSAITPGLLFGGAKVTIEELPGEDDEPPPLQPCPAGCRQMRWPSPANKRKFAHR